MATGQDTLWEKFLQPIFGFLIDNQELKELAEGIDWKMACDRLKDPDLLYPEYYSSQNFHGIRGGYLTISAAVSYDSVTKHALPPNEDWNRESVIRGITGSPRKILDLGCGTGSTTLMLKKAVPDGEIIGLDLSPQMLVMSEYKAQQAKLDIEWVHGIAEATNFADGEFDLVTAWLTDIFEEPYIQEYAAGSVDAWLGKAGFSQVLTEDVWWTNQLSTGVKSIDN